MVKHDSPERNVSRAQADFFPSLQKVRLEVTQGHLLNIGVLMPRNPLPIASIEFQVSIPGRTMMFDHHPTD
ncbi:MAG TPA: hypothetical protein VF135_06705, partial [Terriglobales bacterium]